MGVQMAAECRVLCGLWLVECVAGGNLKTIMKQAPIHAAKAVPRPMHSALRAHQQLDPATQQQQQLRYELRGRRRALLARECGLDGVAGTVRRIAYAEPPPHAEDSSSHPSAQCLRLHRR
jgi:hypothetical protein